MKSPESLKIIVIGDEELNCNLLQKPVNYAEVDQWLNSFVAGYRQSIKSK